MPGALLRQFVEHWTAGVAGARCICVSAGRECPLPGDLGGDVGRQLLADSVSSRRRPQAALRGKSPAFQRRLSAAMGNRGCRPEAGSPSCHWQKRGSPPSCQLARVAPRSAEGDSSTVGTHCFPIFDPMKFTTLIGGVSPDCATSGYSVPSPMNLPACLTSKTWTSCPGK